MSGGWIFYKDPGTGEEVDLELDVIFTESPTGEATATEHPVEEGADIADHVRASPRGVSIEALVTNAPLFVKAPAMTYNEGSRPPRFELQGALSKEERVGWADQTLERIRTEKLSVRLVTKRREYKDMVLTSYRPTEDKSTGDALRFSASFKRIIKVSTRTVATAAPKPVPGARKDRGPQPKKESTTPVEKRVSLLRQGWRLGGGQ